MAYKDKKSMEIDISGEKPVSRKFSDMAGFFRDGDSLQIPPGKDLYFMYRGMAKKDGLRYDITIIPSGLIGSEFIKTKGHKHANLFPELYIVLEGKAIFLMQKMNSGVTDVYFVEANAGQAVIIPGNYGHVTINHGQINLKMANWISSLCQSDYSLFETKAGACYYYTENGWVKNHNYGSEIPPLRKENPLEKEPENLDFLKTPQV